MRLMCLIISGALLSGALTVAALNGSPYETLKNALFNAFAYESFMMQGEFKVMLDGVVEEHDTVNIIVTPNGSLENGDNFFTLTYNNLRINQSYSAGDGTQWYSARIDRWGSNQGPWPTITAEDRNSAQFQFMELFIDILVGDLKNNMYMSTNDGVRRISGSVSHNQLPELVRLGIDMMIEQSRTWHRGYYGTRDDFRHPMDIPMRSLTFDNISGEAYVDAMGNLLSINANASATIVNVFGDSHLAEISLDIRFSELGSAVLEHSLMEAAALLTPEFIEREFGQRYRTVYFTRAEDGSMNRESLMDAWPGNLSRENALTELVTAEAEHICADYYDCERFDAYFERVNAYVAEGYYREALDLVLDMMDLALTPSDLDEDFAVICSYMWDRLINFAMELDPAYF